MKSLLRILGVIVIAVSVVAQQGASIARADGCANVTFEVVANVGLVEVSPGVFVLGGLPTPVTIGGIPGLLGSVVTGMEASGKGAQHFTLVHTFLSTDPARPGSFFTEDQAVGAPAGKDPNIVIINDVLSVIHGTGVFANADGFMMNHAILNFYDFTLTTSVHGRVCADGL